MVAVPLPGPLAIMEVEAATLVSLVVTFSVTKVSSSRVAVSLAAEDVGTGSLPPLPLPPHEVMMKSELVSETSSEVDRGKKRVLFAVEYSKGQGDYVRVNGLTEVIWERLSRQISQYP
jgi:hypothetical protein